MRRFIEFGFVNDFSFEEKCLCSWTTFTFVNAITFVTGERLTSVMNVSYYWFLYGTNLRTATRCRLPNIKYMDKIQR